MGMIKMSRKDKKDNLLSIFSLSLIMLRDEGFIDQMDVKRCTDAVYEGFSRKENEGEYNE